MKLDKIRYCDIYFASVTLCYLLFLVVSTLTHTSDKIMPTMIFVWLGLVVVGVFFKEYNTKFRAGFNSVPEGFIVSPPDDGLPLPEPVTPPVEQPLPVISGVQDPAPLPFKLENIINVASIIDLPAVGEDDKVYVTLNDSKTYRWNGVGYVDASGYSDEAQTNTSPGSPG